MSEPTDLSAYLDDPDDAAAIDAARAHIQATEWYRQMETMNLLLRIGRGDLAIQRAQKLRTPQEGTDAP